jgi:uncharacterized protein YndB with AHSA1/START domain
VIDDGAVVHEIHLGLGPDEVFAFLTDPVKLVRWIGLSAELDPQPGGLFRFEIVPGQHCEGRYVEVVPSRRVVFTWGWTDPDWHLPPGSSRVEIDLVAESSGTRLVLVHRDLPGDLRAIHDEGWTTFLAQLVERAAAEVDVDGEVAG